MINFASELYIEETWFIFMHLFGKSLYSATCSHMARHTSSLLLPVATLYWLKSWFILLWRKKNIIRDRSPKSKISQAEKGD